MAEEQDDLAEGDIHELLRNQRRRLTIEALQETPENQMSVRALSEEIAAIETDEHPAPRNKRQSVYVSLTQTHLPKLAKFDVVDYDDDTKQIALTGRVKEVEIYMEVVPRYGLSWGELYFGLGLLGLLTVLAVLLGVPGIAAFNITLVASGFFVLLMLAAAYQVASQQDNVLLHRFRR